LTDGTFATHVARALERSPRWLGAALFVAWSAMMFALSAQPEPAVGKIMRPFGAWGHNTLHAPEYAVFALLFLWATARSGGKLAATHARIWLCALVVLAWGASDEWHQSFTPGRDASVCDVLTDLTGGVFAALILRAAESGAGSARMLRWVLLAVLACALAALIATLLPATRPDLTWL
jgi:hypothetical protein